jgi:hypothetical protein
VALHSFLRCIGSRNLFYITDTDGLRDKNKSLLTSFGITILHTDYARQFNIAYRNTSSAAYNQFIGPELLYKNNYTYSIGIQPDVICIQYFDPYPIFESTSFFTTTKNPSYPLADHLKKNRIGIPYNHSLRNLHNHAIIPDVLFCNNQALSQFLFSQKAIYAFNSIGPENLLKNEESLLIHFTLEIKNFCMGNTLYSLGGYSHDRHTEPTFLHYNVHKPWNPLRTPKYMYQAAHHAVWRKAALDILGEELYNVEIRSKF